MSEFVRLIALAVVTFLVALIVTIISNPGLTSLVAAKLGFEYIPEDGFATRMPEPLMAGDDVLAVPRPDPLLWTGVAGFPSRTDLHFPLPPGVALSSGQLQLVLNSQMIETAAGQVTVAINGTSRDVIVVEPGRQQHTLVYPLGPTDLAASRIVVSLIGDGGTHQGWMCSSQYGNPGLAVEIDPTTALMLRYQGEAPQPATTLTVRPAPLILEFADDPQSAARALWAMQYLGRSGVAAAFGEAAPHAVKLVAPEAAPQDEEETGIRWPATGPDLDRLVAMRGGSLPQAHARQWPVPLVALGADTATRGVRHAHRWRINYRLADLPGGRMPDRLDLALAVSRRPRPADWRLRVTLDGNLIHSSTNEEGDGFLNVSVPLPAHLQGLTNTIEVTLTDPAADGTDCANGARDLAAQLLPSSVLHHDDRLASSADEALTRALAGDRRVALSTPEGLSRVSASRASMLLGQVLPLSTDIVFGPGSPRITVLKPGARIPDDEPMDVRFLVVDSGTDVTVERVPVPAPNRQLDDAAMGLLIEW